MNVKTDELINLLAEDAPVRIGNDRAMALALIAGAVVSTAVLVLFIGVRPDLTTAFDTPRALFKICQTLILALVAAALVFPIGRPGAALRNRALALALPTGLLAVAVAAELLVLPQQDWKRSMIGNYADYCLLYVPILSLAPLFCLLLALKGAAPDRPGLAGAVAGLAAGGIAAAIYAWHCHDDSPLFLAVWYPIAIAIVILAGFLVGRRLLRW
jgi:hypothetical protein